jgi:predicted small secreted protein
MYTASFLKGLGIGVAAGTIAGIALSTDKKKLGMKTGKIVRAIGEVAGGVIRAIES